jgi:hypothetical protein
MKLARPAPVEPFFLPARGGGRYCLYHPPVLPPGEAVPCRGALLQVHAFAEELNRCRRMSALQSRMLAGHGVAVLQIDLYGCGDSAGDFSDARWEIWKEDLALASRWLENRTGMAVSLWGQRLGALLALDFATGLDSPSGAPPAGREPGGPRRPDDVSSTRAVERLVFWQPVLRGETALTQFLRLRLAGQLGGAGGDPGQDSGPAEGIDPASGADCGQETVAGLRARMARGETVEVAGYALHPELAGAIDAADAATMNIPRAPVHWLDVALTAGQPSPAARQRTLAAWRARGARVEHDVATGPAFWASQEITECAPLLAKTAAIWAPAGPAS